MIGNVVVEASVGCSAKTDCVCLDTGLNLQLEVISALLLIKCAQLEVFLTLSQLTGENLPDHCIVVLNRKDIRIAAAFNTFLADHLPLLSTFHQTKKLTIVMWPHSVPVEQYQQLQHELQHAETEARQAAAEARQATAEARQANLLAISIALAAILFCVLFASGSGGATPKMEL